MANIIYGVDVDGLVTAEAVRDAITKCFFEAHCQDSDIGYNDDEAGKLYCRDLVKKAFTETGGNWDNPTKESIMKALGYLKEFSANFRNPEVIQKHYSEIMILVNKL